MFIIHRRFGVDSETFIPLYYCNKIFLPQAETRYIIIYDINIYSYFEEISFLEQTKKTGNDQSYLDIVPNKSEGTSTFICISSAWGFIYALSAFSMLVTNN